MLMKRGNKKGQFYLLAAIIIIVLITGFAAISNYAKKKGSVKLYDIKDELQIEGGEVLEYGVYPGKESKIEEFIEDYQEYAGEGKDLYFVFGNEDEIQSFAFREILVTSEVVGGGKITTSELKVNKTTLENVEIGELVEVIVNDNKYKFELKPGENFFFVISQEVEGEKHIVTG